MKLTNFLTVLLVCIYLTEGRTYGYGRRKKIVRPRNRKRFNKPSFIPHIKKDPCPPVPCTLEAIRLDCRKKTYFMKDGKKCRGCDQNICRDKIDHFDKPWGRKDKQIPKGTIKNKPTKVVEVPVPVEVPVEVPVRVDVPVPVPVRDLRLPGLPTHSVGPFDAQRPNLRNGPRGDLLNPDPIAVVNSPPSDSEFVNRLRFDRNNANLLQPPSSQPIFPNGMPNANQMQPPFPQGPINSNAWGSQGFANPNMPNGGNQWLQNQMTAAQLQAQQGAMQFQGQQGWGQFPGQFAPGIGQNVGGPQGFPSWGLNPNPFVNGMQQQVTQSNLGFQQGIGGNIPPQTSQFLNQMPPVPGINGNFQGQATFAANTWAGASGLGTGTGLGPSGQGNFQTQNNQGFFVDPVTNQPLPGNTNSLHGPIN